MKPLGLASSGVGGFALNCGWDWHGVRGFSVGWAVYLGAVVGSGSGSSPGSVERMMATVEGLPRVVLV